MSGECDDCGEHCLDCRCDKVEALYKLGLVGCIKDEHADIRAILLDFSIKLTQSSLLKFDDTMLSDIQEFIDFYIRHNLEQE